MNKTTKKNDNNKWYDCVDNFNNPVLLTGLAKKIVYESDKVNKVCFEVASKTQNNKIRRAWITLTDFKKCLEVGKVYDITTTIVSNSHNNKMTLEFFLEEYCEL